MAGFFKYFCIETTPKYLERYFLPLTVHRSLMAVSGKLPTSDYCGWKRKKKKKKEREERMNDRRRGRTCDLLRIHIYDEFVKQTP